MVTLILNHLGVQLLLGLGFVGYLAQVWPLYKSSGL